MPKLKTFSNPYFETNIFNKTVKFANTQNQPSYIQNRVSRLKSKEPETIEWINSMNPNSIFFDVGANIGIYTICAGAKNIKTYSFEPHAVNFSNLCETISVNNYDHCVAYCLALSDQSKFDKISIKNYYAGVADNQVGQSNDLSHGVMTHTLDEFVLNNVLPQPTHIKIDVDGHEEKFYKGAKETLKKCHSILFEIENQYSYIAEDIINFGFKLNGKYKRNEEENNYIFSK